MCQGAVQQAQEITGCSSPKQVLQFMLSSGGQPTLLEECCKIFSDAGATTSNSSQYDFHLGPTADLCATASLLNSSSDEVVEQLVECFLADVAMDVEEAEVDEDKQQMQECPLGCRFLRCVSLLDFLSRSGAKGGKSQLHGISEVLKQMLIWAGHVSAALLKHAIQITKLHIGRDYPSVLNLLSADGLPAAALGSLSTDLTSVLWTHSTRKYFSDVSSYRKLLDLHSRLHSAGYDKQATAMRKMVGELQVPESLAKYMQRKCRQNSPNDMLRLEEAELEEIIEDYQLELEQNEKASARAKKEAEAVQHRKSFFLDTDGTNGNLTEEDRALMRQTEELKAFVTDEPEDVAEDALNMGLEGLEEDEEGEDSEAADTDDDVINADDKGVEEDVDHKDEGDEVLKTRSSRILTRKRQTKCESDVDMSFAEGGSVARRTRRKAA